MISYTPNIRSAAGVSNKQTPGSMWLAV